MLLKLLGLPATFPLWVVHKVMEQAEGQFYDQKAILSQLAEIHQLHEQHAISDKSFPRQNKMLIDRLKEAQRRESEKEGEKMAKALTADVARCAKAHLNELTGLIPEIISAIHFDDKYWYVEVEALEISRIPPTTDILNTYSVQLDGDGKLIEYRRLRRYSAIRHRNSNKNHECFRPPGTCEHCRGGADQSR